MNVNRSARGRVEPRMARGDSAAVQLRAGSKRTQTVMRLHDHRFLHLCQLLAANSDKFVWTTFRELPLDEITANLAPLCLRSSLSRTLRRYCEQAAARAW